MHYAENQIPVRWSWFLILFFLLLYLPHLGVTPLSRLEAMAVLGTVEPGLVTGGDRGVVTYPLYPMVVDFFRAGLGPNEWAVRLPSVAAILGMAFCSALLTRRSSPERLPLIVAVLLTFLPVYAIIFGRTASGHALSSFLLVTAWFSWYYLGRCRHRWSSAWAVALALVLMAAFQTGPQAFAIFYFPLFFLRRPFTVWRRLRMPQHLVFIVLALLIFVFWFHGQMKDSFLLPLESVLSEPGMGFRRSLYFPVRAFVLLFPLPCFCWPGFCAAFRPLEKNREIATFLRTLVISLFIAFWILPQAADSNLLVLIPPLAVLSGMHYEILIRRYHYVLNRFFPLIENTILGLSVLLAFGWTLAAAGIINIEELPGRHLLTALSTALIIGSIWWILKRRHAAVGPYWLRTGLIAVAVNLLIITGWLPLHSLFLQMHRDRGVMLREQVPEKAVIYKMTSLPLFQESFYMRRNMVSVDSAGQLLREVPPVWVLGGYNRPLLDHFSWQPASSLVNTNFTYYPSFEWVPDGRTLLSVRRRIETGEQPEALAAVRVYQGIPRLDQSGGR